jgi:hypothetical protein
VTDRDLYATVLGKAFHGVTAILCGHDADAGAQAVADYVHRELRRMVKDLDGCCSGIARDLEHSGSLLGRDALQERVDRASTESIGTQHIADAVRHACEREGTPQAFFRRLAELGVDSVQTRLALQKEFRDNQDCQRKFDAVRSDVVERYERLLAAPCGIGVAAPPARARLQTGELLELVVARSAP